MGRASSQKGKSTRALPRSQSHAALAKRTHNRFHIECLAGNELSTIKMGLSGRWNASSNEKHSQLPPTLCPITQQLANWHLGQTSYADGSNRCLSNPPRNARDPSAWRQREQPEGSGQQDSLQPARPKRYRSKILQQICLENQLSSRMPGSQALRPCQGLPHMGWPTRAPVRSPTPVRIYPQFSLPGRVRPTGMYEVCQYTRMRAGNYVTNALSNMSALDELAASAPPTTPATEVSSTLAFRLAGRPPAPAGCLATRMHQRSTRPTPH